MAMNEKKSKIETISRSISTETLFDRNMVEAILAAFDMLSPYSVGRTKRVSSWARSIASVLDLDEAALKDVEYAAMLCDLGMLAVPDKIINKKGRLTLSEFRIVQQHPNLTLNTLKALPLSDELKQNIRQHHEAFDGSGYPGHLSGDEITFGAQVINISCALFAITSLRPYRDPVSLIKAYEILSNEKGKQFHPDIVDGLKRTFDEGKITMDAFEPINDPFATIRRDLEFGYES